MKVLKMVTPGLLISGLLLSLACTHAQTKGRLQSEMNALPPVPAHASLPDLGIKAQETIRNSPQLNQVQKQQLMDLQKKTADEATKLRDESFKLREVLITDMTHPDFTIEEINLIKKRLKTAEQKRLDLVFNAIDQANTIIGRRDPANTPILNAFDIDQLHAR